MSDEIKDLNAISDETEEEVAEQPVDEAAEEAVEENAEEAANETAYETEAVEEAEETEAAEQSAEEAVEETEATAEAEEEQAAEEAQSEEETAVEDVEEAQAEEKTVEETAAVEENVPEEGKHSETENYEEVDDSVYDDEEPVGGVKKKKKKKYKRPLTPEQKKKHTVKSLCIAGAVLMALVIFISSVAIANSVGVKALITSAKSFPQVEYVGHTQLHPEKDSDGYWTFTMDDDRDFKVLQFTDIHIGGGSFSQTKDAWAMNAVSTMIKAEQPDLVIVTGDIAYPVPFQVGTFNNLSATQIFANLMESLGVYWTFAFGNHDTEAYSMNNRKDICDWYENQNFHYCLFSRGKNAGEDMGYGNNIIKVKNGAGIVTQALVTLDSHSYIEGDYFGAAWKYDNIHQAQVDWYVEEMQKLVAANVALDPEYDQPIKNLAFFHIPLVEYRDAWAKLFEANGERKATSAEKEQGRYNSLTEVDGVEYYYGIMGESDGKKNGQRTYGVFCGLHQDNFFEEGVLNGLQGTFCGHDHYNNYSVKYTKEVNGEMRSVRLTYGMSVDYVAYAGIYREHSQRGCTVIEINADGDFDCTPKNYYKDYDVKYERN